MFGSSDRREFVRKFGLSAAVMPFLLNLPSLAAPEQLRRRKQRLVIMFSPNGIVPNTFWPKEDGGKFTLPESLTPLQPFQAKTLIIKGLCDQIRGDGDNHMRGIGCLLTGTELFPGNIQGGSHTPAGWAKGHSIDQEIKRFLQKDDATKTRFGSLEFGVMVPDRADTWTRMVYAGPNKPIAPIDNPYQMFQRMYGHVQEKEALAGILDVVREDLKKIGSVVGSEDRRLLEEHTTFVREMEAELKASQGPGIGHAVPKLETNVKTENDNIPKISRMQIDLMVNAFKADFTRIATLQYTNSVGQARMRWLGVDDAHHELSHEPDNNAKAQEKLTKINKWFCQELAYLAKLLADTPEPNGEGSMLDNTTIIWTNELGQGNSHTLDNIPFVLVGGGLGFKMGRSLRIPKTAHNRFLMALAHGFGHHLKSFGSPNFCAAGPLSLT